MRKDKQTKTKTKKRMNLSLLIVVLILLFVGFVMVFSSSSPKGLQNFNDGSYFVKRQIRYGLFGLVIMMIASVFNYRILSGKVSLGIFIISVLTTGLLKTPLGTDLGMGATRWVRLGSFTFMPGDLVKIGSILFLSNLLKEYHDKEKGTNFLISSFATIGISVVAIIIQQDLGTAITLGATLFVMVVVGGLSSKIIAGFSALGVGFVIFLFKHVIHNPKFANSFRIKRLTSFLDPFADSQDTGWQAVQSMYAFAAGGIKGCGLGKSKQKFFYIPEAYNDFIFAIIGEETGFLGGLILIGLYIAILYLGVKIALAAKDAFGYYLAIGITALISLQTVIHMSVVTSIMPTTGITLPFVSYGGTSLIIYLGAIGLLLSISRD